MGRTGTLHAWEQEGVAPDIQAIAKGLGGGYQPIGAMLATNRIVDTIRDGSGAFQHGHTYLAHPLACAAALEVQRVIGEEKLLDRVRELGAHLEKRLTERFGNHRHVGDIRGRGLFQAIELVADRGYAEILRSRPQASPEDQGCGLRGRARLLSLGRHGRRQERRSRPAGAALYLHVK